jgi:zinc D-Ala-D-Ala dipeptidase
MIRSHCSSGPDRTACSAEAHRRNRRVRADETPGEPRRSSAVSGVPCADAGLMSNRSENEHVVVYEHQLPSLQPGWAGFPPLPLLEPSEHWAPIEDDGEPLVRIDQEMLCTAAQWRRGWPGTSPHTYVRRRVAAALAVVRTALPEGFDLAVLDAHRSQHTQRHLYERAYHGTDLAPGFVADPDHVEIVPPHTTGGAVDVTLTWQGTPLAIGTVPGTYVAASALAAFEDKPGVTRELRRVLYAVMTSAGFCGIAEEWWHYSIGDQEWAWQNGFRAALFAPVERPDSPDAA